MLNVLVLFIFFVTTFIVTYPLTLHLDSMVTNPIDPLFYVWNLSHNIHALTSGISMLDTNMFYPETNTLAYSDHLFAQTLQTLPLFLAINNPLLIQNIYLLSTFVVAAFGMYLLVRFLIKEHSAIATVASVLSGLLYSFSYYHIDHLGQVPTASIQWIPLSFLYLIKSHETNKTRHFFLFFVFFTLNFLSTMYYGIFLSTAVAVFFIMKVRSWKYMKRFTLVSFPFIIILIVSLYPYLRLHVENPAIVRTLEESSWRSAHLQDYISRIAPHDRTLYLGIIPILLIAAYVFMKKKTKWWLYFAMVASVSIILSLGPQQHDIRLPYYYVYKLVPLFQAIRVPARFGIMTICSISILTGFAFFSFISSIQKVRLQILIGIIIVAVTVIDYFHAPAPFVTIPTLKEAPPIYHWLATQPNNAVILELPLKLDTHSNHIEDQVYKTYDTITEDDNFVAETFRLYFSTLHWKRMVNGYSGYFPQNYSDLAGNMEHFPSKESIDYIKQRNIDYIIIHTRQYEKRWQQIEESITATNRLKKVIELYPDVVYQLSGTNVPKLQ